MWQRMHLLAQMKNVVAAVDARATQLNRQNAPDRMNRRDFETGAVAVGAAVGEKNEEFCQKGY